MNKCECTNSQIGEYRVKDGIGRNVRANFCPFCGANIRKPEGKSLIVKSGETWAAHWKGVDYLWTTPEKPEHDFFQFEGKDIIMPGWKLFTEIELTDEIAKLRPMVIEGCIGEKPRIIYGIDNGKGVFVDHARYRTRLHLATLYELQEAE